MRGGFSLGAGGWLVRGRGGEGLGTQRPLLPATCGQKEEERWHCVETYLPTSDKAGDAQRLMTAAIRAVPDGARLMVLGDLNADLDSPRGRQEDVLAAEASEHDLVCATKQFRCRRKRRHVRGWWTFRRPTYTPEGERRWVRGKPDYRSCR